MKSHRKELWFNIPSRRGFVNITRDVEVAIQESSIKEGLVLVKPNTMPSNTSPGLRWNARGRSDGKIKNDPKGRFLSYVVSIF